MPREVSTRQGSVVALGGALWGRVCVAVNFDDYWANNLSSLFLGKSDRLGGRS